MRHRVANAKEIIVRVNTTDFNYIAGCNFNFGSIKERSGEPLGKISKKL